MHYNIIIYELCHNNLDHIKVADNAVEWGACNITETTIDMRLRFGYVGKQSILDSLAKWLTSAIVLREDMASYRNSRV